MRYNYTAINIALKKLTVSACEDVEQQEPSSLQVGMKNETVLEDSLAVFLTKVSVDLSYHLAISLLSIELKTCPHENLHVDILALLFIIAKNWKHPKYPSISKWINNQDASV